MPTNDVAIPPELIRALMTDQACFDHEVKQLRLFETHISWVVLTGEFAYKIKKPVYLGFLDFSTLALRKQACDDEVRLNRRLAPETYLAVVAITGNPDKPHIEGSGTAFEYAVKMRQFSPDDTMDKLSDRGELGVEHIDALASRLAQFHLYESAATRADQLYGDPASIFKPVEDNFRILDGLLADSVQKQCLSLLHRWCSAEHERLTPLMLKRRQQGKVRECHGDLHLGNLAWSDGQLIIFDCIEFSPQLRWIDVMSEVAFCFMDLLHRSQRELAFRFLNAWLEICGDYEGVVLLRYYAVYRAMVRAKVAALRAQQSAGNNTVVDEYLQLAQQLIQPKSLELWITHGFSGCGKTTQSQKLLQERGMVRVRSDVERKRLAGIRATASSSNRIQEGLYTPEASRRTYTHLSKMAAGLLDNGWPVIVDATFLFRWQRNMFREIARKHSAQLHLLDIHADPATLRQHITQRAVMGGDASEANLQVLQHQIETSEPLGSDEPVALELSFDSAQTS